MSDNIENLRIQVITAGDRLVYTSTNQQTYEIAAGMPGVMDIESSARAVGITVSNLRDTADEVLGKSLIATESARRILGIAATGSVDERLLAASTASADYHVRLQAIQARHAEMQNGAEELAQLLARAGTLANTVMEHAVTLAGMAAEAEVVHGTAMDNLTELLKDL